MCLSRFQAGGSFETQLGEVLRGFENICSHALAVPKRAMRRGDLLGLGGCRLEGTCRLQWGLDGLFSVVQTDRAVAARTFASLKE